MHPIKVQQPFNYFYLFIVAIVIIESIVKLAHSQEMSLEELTQTEAQFWDAYNACDIDRVRTFLKHDVEFYHDKEGVLLTSKALVKTLQKNLCADAGVRLRRELVIETQSVYPLQGTGAIITGEHTFFLGRQGENERLDSEAKFIHVWLFDDKSWKLSRVFSFDHKVVPFVHESSGFSMSDNDLQAYTGEYRLAHMGTVSIHLNNGMLLVKTEGFKAKIHPESTTVFYVKDMPLTFHFKKGIGGDIAEFDVLENGKKVDNAHRVK